MEHIVEKKVYLPKYNNMIDISLEFYPLQLSRGSDMVDDMIINQIIRELKEPIEKISKSELPQKFIDGQSFFITNRLPISNYALFDLIDDNIYVDADVASNIRTISATFILAHEIGHKIDKYTETSRVYQELANIFNLSINDQETLSETFADICGNIVSGMNHYHELSENVSEDKNNYAKRLVLGSIYR